jgi:hypothetical protein
MFRSKFVDEVKTHFIYNNPSSQNRAFFRQATDDNITRHMLFAWWIPKATNTRSEYVTFIAFPRQQRLRERASTFNACLVFYTHNTQVLFVICKLPGNARR